MPALPAPVPPPSIRIRDAPGGSVPTTYGALYSSPHPGIVAGIVLASIAAYLLVIWVIYTCLNIAPPVHGDAVSTYLGGESVVTLSTVRRSKSRPPRRPVRVRERVEVRRTSGSRRPPPEIVDEPESESDVFMGGGRSAGRGGTTLSTVTDDDDEIIVEEEHGRRDRRSHSRRGSSYYDEDRMGGRRYDRRSRRRSSDDDLAY